MNDFHVGDTRYPFGIAEKQTISVVGATTAATVWNSETLIDLGEITQNTTLNLATDKETVVGSRLCVKVKSDATARNVTPGAGFTGTTIAGVATKTRLASFVYDGATFLHLSTQQLD